jgi:hypothetical protein
MSLPSSRLCPLPVLGPCPLLSPSLFPSLPSSHPCPLSVPTIFPSRPLSRRRYPDLLPKFRPPNIRRKRFGVPNPPPNFLRRKSAGKNADIRILSADFRCRGSSSTTPLSFNNQHCNGSMLHRPEHENCMIASIVFLCHPSTSVVHPSVLTSNSLVVLSAIAAIAIAPLLWNNLPLSMRQPSSKSSSRTQFSTKIH